ncbi:hypothetical protein ACOCJ4_08745 [Knoellia sp. CPCC 206435]|uniref:hypothetical protein n=1 Tax=Knoellia terrae TaxID=3404797 RepID=UPI003B4347C6
MSDREIDAQFDAIVARWDDEAPPPPCPRTVQDITTAYAALTRDEPSKPDEPSEPSEPEETTRPDPLGDRDGTEDAVTGGRVAAAGPVPSVPSVPTTAPAPGGGTGSDIGPAAAESWRQGPSIDAEDDHFEPGPVSLPPGEDIGYWGALLGLVGGPLLLLWVALSSPFHAGWWVLGGIALFLGGFGLLVLRQPAHRDPFDDDDGARV